MKSFRVVLLTCLFAFDTRGAVHPTKAQEAYFAAHDQCVRDLKAAKKNGTDPRTAQAQYRKCEARAHLVWKYYPKRPPSP